MVLCRWKRQPVRRRVQDHQKGKKYAFRNDGRMVNGLKFIKGEGTGSLDVKADDDDNKPFDDEDRFDENALWYEAKWLRLLLLR